MEMNAFNKTHSQPTWIPSQNVTSPKIQSQLIVDICQKSLPPCVLSGFAEAKGSKAERRELRSFEPLGALGSRGELRADRAINFHPQRFWRETLNRQQRSLFQNLPVTKA